MFIGVASFYFVSELFGVAANPYLADFGSNYFAYVLVGMAFLGFQSVGLGTFSSAVAGAQSQGTLEAMLVTPTKLPAIVLSSSLWDFIYATINVVVYLAIGALFFGADLGGANIPAAVVVLVLSVIVFSAVGIASASAIMVLKRGDPVAWLFGSVSAFMGGTYFPIAVLPDWLQTVAHFFPVYYSLRAMRLAVLEGTTLQQMSGDVLVLVGFAVVLVPLSMLAFRGAVKIAKTDGTLGTY
jgi:ABC-2 type transport system permease protein